MSRYQCIAYAVVRSLLRLAVRLLTRTSVRGREHLPRVGAGIVVSNHIAAVDPGVLVAAPFAARSPTDPAQRDDRERVTGEIMARIAALLPPEMRGAYANGAPDPQAQLVGRHVSQGQMEQ